MIKFNFIKSLMSKILYIIGYKAFPLHTIINQRDSIIDIKNLLHNNHEIVILDIGAHHGKIIEISIKEFPNAIIYAFEPQHSDFIKLKEKYSQNKNIKLFNLALSDKTGKQTLFLTKKSDSSSLLEPLGKYYSEQTLTGKETVKTMTLSSWIDTG